MPLDQGGREYTPQEARAGLGATLMIVLVLLAAYWLWPVLKVIAVVRLAFG